jgi:hypothetical protein
MYRVLGDVLKIVNTVNIGRSGAGDGSAAAPSKRPDSVDERWRFAESGNRHSRNCALYRQTCCPLLH